MRLAITILLVLFASYADIFLYRRGIIPVTPAYFLIPLFFVLFALRNNPLDYLSLTKSHTFQFYFSLVVLTILFASMSMARPGVIIVAIVLNIIGLLLYWFAVHHFRTSSKFLLGLFLVLAFFTLAGSLWYDTFKGLPLPTTLVKGSIRKGGFGENPNVAASGIKFLGFALLLFFRKKVFWRYFFMILTIASVFLTFSRSGIISVLIIVLALMFNNWKIEFNINAKAIFTKGIKAFLFLGIIYIGLYVSMEILKSEVPEFAEGDIAKRIDQILGKSDNTFINADDNSQMGRNSLRKKYLGYFFEKPILGHGTGFALDPMLNILNSHNYYLFVGVEYGLLGILTFLFFLYRCFRMALKHNQFYYFVLGILLMFEGLISHGMFEERAIILTIAFFDAYLYPYHINELKEDEFGQIAEPT